MSTKKSATKESIESQPHGVYDQEWIDTVGLYCNGSLHHNSLNRLESEILGMGIDNTGARDELGRSNWNRKSSIIQAEYLRVYFCSLGYRGMEKRYIHYLLDLYTFEQRWEEMEKLIQKYIEDEISIDNRISSIHFSLDMLYDGYFQAMLLKYYSLLLKKDRASHSILLSVSYFKKSYDIFKNLCSKRSSAYFHGKIGNFLGDLSYLCQDIADCYLSLAKRAKSSEKKRILFGKQIEFCVASLKVVRLSPANDFSHYFVEKSVAEYLDSTYATLTEEFQENVYYYERLANLLHFLKRLRNVVDPKVVVLRLRDEIGCLERISDFLFAYPEMKRLCRRICIRILSLIEFEAKRLREVQEWKKLPMDRFFGELLESYIFALHKVHKCSKNHSGRLKEEGGKFLTSSEYVRKIFCLVSDGDWRAISENAATVCRRERKIRGGVAKQCSCCGSMKKSNKKCGRCKLFFYCSVRCQRTDWTKHRVYCVDWKETLV